MKSTWGIAAGFAALVLAGGTTPASVQNGAQAGAVLNRMSSAYRSIQSYKDTATMTRKAGDKEITSSVLLVAQRPNKYLLEVKGDKVNTVVVGDGTTLMAIRPDRKAYTKTKSPVRLMNADYLGKMDVPSAGARIITTLLQNNLRNPDDTLAKDILDAKIEQPQPFGDKMAYVLTFRYDADYDAKVYVTDTDYLIRRVTLVHDGKAEVIENHDQIEIDKPIPADTFTRALPAGAQLVFNLPALEKVVVASSGPMAPDFTADALGGGKLRLSDYKGKIVIVDFWATWCGPCQRSMPHVEKVHRASRDQDVVVLGICVWDERSAYEQWIPEHQNDYTFTFAFDPAGKAHGQDIASRLYKVDGIPTTLVIDKEGHLAAKIVGFSEGDTRIEAALRKLGVNISTDK